MKNIIARMGFFICLLLTCLAHGQTSDSKSQSQDKPESYTNTIKWTTASEVDNFGFEIYRAEKEDGPFTKINTSPIEGAGTTDSPSYYKYVDETIDPHKAYFYYVESISMDGVRENFTPIIKAKPKIGK